MLHIIYPKPPSPIGLSEMIQTQDPVRATVGEEAVFTCLLTQSKNVLQVTWQKMLPVGTENVATCNKRFGTKINPPFQGKVAFEDTGLQNTTIVVRNVTKADECCYRCLFNAYPEGAIYRKTCLIVDGKCLGLSLSLSLSVRVCVCVCVCMCVLKPHCSDLLRTSVLVFSNMGAVNLVLEGLSSRSI